MKLGTGQEGWAAWCAASAVLTFALIGSARPAGAADGPARYPYQIVATTGMVADVVRRVAGDRADVTNLIGAGVDPHLYKVTRNDVAQLLKADIVFHNGLRLEGKMAGALARVGRKKPVHAVTELLDQEYVLELPGRETHHDPHVWMDVRAWMKAAAAVAQALSEYDPHNASQYHANADRYARELEGLDEYVRGVMGTVPKQQRVLITAHDAFNYFGRAYDVRVEGIQGLSTESEAGLKRINELIDFIVANRIRAVFVESSVAEKNVRALVEGARARGYDLVVGGTLFSDAMGAPGTYCGTYVGMIDHNATIICRALGGQAPEGGMQGRLSAQW